MRPSVPFELGEAGTRWNASLPWGLSSALTGQRSRLKCPARITETFMAANNSPSNFKSVLQEKRVFPPNKKFSASAHVKSLAQYRRLYNESIRSPEKFWAKQ